ncbi:hypothetical protein JCM18899A_18640 [Nocardioides sp. AN3]
MSNDLPETCACGEETRTLKGSIVFCPHCDRACSVGQSKCERCKAFALKRS